MKTCFAHFFL